MSTTQNIPLIIPAFNQPSFVKQLVNWWKFYHPNNPVYIVDNGSTSKALHSYYREVQEKGGDIYIHAMPENNMPGNMRAFIDTVIKNAGYEYYVISDPDILPHPNTPFNYLEVLKGIIDSGCHRAGFNLIIDNLPEDLYDKNNIVHNERTFLEAPVITHGKFTGYRAPIDTTFCLYTTKNSGWHAPMDGQDWSNCIRIFESFHLGWYLTDSNCNEEMEYYFNSAKFRTPGLPSAGMNNNRPSKFVKQ